MNNKAKIIEIKEPETGAGKNGKDWYRQLVIVEETEGQYPKKIALTFRKETRLEVGEVLDFHVNIESREWNGKWFTDVVCWKV